MRTRAVSLALALAFAAGTITPCLAEDLPLADLQKRLAEKNYYPSLEGLKDAEVDVKCNVLDQVVAAFPDAAGKPIEVHFFWSRPSMDVPPKKKFDIKGIPPELKDLAARAQQIFMGKEDLVITAPVYETVETTNATASVDGGRITVTGVAKNPSDQIKKLVVDIDAATYQVQKVQMDLGQAQATLEMVSKDLGGKWGVESTVVSAPQVKQVFKFEYAQVEGFWLPSRMTVDYQSPDGQPLPNAPSFVYDFSGWKVNKGLPEGTF